jgi:PAS domain S-box-containing protein
MSTDPAAHQGPAERIPAARFAVEGGTQRRQGARALKASEVRYRRLFETAQDAILILDGVTGRIIDANPFLTNLLGYSAKELLGKELWEIGRFQDIEASRAAFRQLQEKHYLRYEDLPLETRDGRTAYVEFVSNVYRVENHTVIQCNIRDISDRKRAEEALREADRCKDEFLALVAHELRNPLAPLRHAIQVMRLKGTKDRDVQVPARWRRDNPRTHRRGGRVRPPRGRSPELEPFRQWRSQTGANMLRPGT